MGNAKKEGEITSQMIEAGVLAFDWNSRTAHPELLVEVIYRAMRKAQQQRPHRSAPVDDHSSPAKEATAQ
jgi:hypothetical protein